MSFLSFETGGFATTVDTVCETPTVFSAANFHCAEVKLGMGGGVACDHRLDTQATAALSESKPTGCRRSHRRPLLPTLLALRPMGRSGSMGITAAPAGYERLAPINQRQIGKPFGSEGELLRHAHRDRDLNTGMCKLAVSGLISPPGTVAWPPQMNAPERAVEPPPGCRPGIGQGPPGSGHVA